MLLVGFQFLLDKLAILFQWHGICSLENNKSWVNIIINYYIYLIYYFSVDRMTVLMLPAGCRALSDYPILVTSCPLPPTVIIILNVSCDHVFCLLYRGSKIPLV
jgi:hypothetical protein